MTDRFYVTDEMMKNAASYIPLEEKEALAGLIAQLCVVPCTIDETDESENDIFAIPAPPMYRENTMEKTLCLTGCFLKFYLKQNVEAMNIPVEEYNGWAGTHLMNQIERYKGTPYKMKAFDMLSDFRDLEKRVNCAIYARLNQRNDPCRRLLAAMMVMSSEDGLKEAQQLIEASAKGIAEEHARQERIIQEAGDAK
jgi:hypothetical protein